MSCEDTREMIEAYLDGELDSANSRKVERHLAECAGCQTRREQLEQLSSVVRQKELYWEAPAGLSNQIRSQLGVREEQPKPVRAVWQWAMAAGLALAVLTGGMFLLRERPSSDDLLAREVTASHIRSLMANHLMDVESTDQHTVKPWFNGRLDFTPNVVNLTAQGFPLIGGRLDYLDQHPVAALLYRRSQHPINVFEWPANGDEKTKTFAVRGYNIVHWTYKGMNYWAVSDLNLRELEELAGDLKK